MNWVRWFPGDYLRDTLHLTLTEDGAYRRLLDLYYSKEHALTIDREELYRALRVSTPEEKNAVEAVLKQFFFVRGKHLHNKRASAELVRAREKYQLCVKGGKERASRAAAAQLQLSSSSAIQKDPDKKKLKTPLPPTNVGASPLKVLPVPPRNGLQYIERWGQTIEVDMGRHTRPLNLGDRTAGMSNEQFVDYLTSKGFPARIKDPQ